MVILENTQTKLFAKEVEMFPQEEGKYKDVATNYKQKLLTIQKVFSWATYYRRKQTYEAYYIIWHT